MENENNETNCYNDDFDVIQTQTTVDIGEENIEQDNFYVIPLVENQTVEAIHNNAIMETTTLEVINQKIDNLSLKLDFFIQTNAEMKTLLTKVMDTIKNEKSCSHSNSDDTEFRDDIVTEFNFPLSTTENVDEFEKKLADKEFYHKMITRYQIIGGTSGKQDGEKVASRLIKELFTTSVLCQYTWKGISTSKNEARPMTIFSKNERIIDFLFKLVGKADSSTTKVSTEKFLQFKIFKRNTQRLKREINKKRKSCNENENLTMTNEVETENIDPNLGETEAEMNFNTNAMDETGDIDND